LNKFDSDFLTMMKLIAIVTKNNASAIQAGEALRSWLAARNIHANLLINEPEPSVTPLPAETEVIIVFGGDGTLLSAARHYGQQGTPILGVNVGGLGFITAINLEKLYPILEKVLNHDFQVEERMQLTGKVIRQGEVFCEQSVLNDVVINKGALARIVEIRTYIENEYLTTYRADGFIIAPPTGSTGYSLGAGGPIVFPTLHSITLLPICPFMLTNRPLILPDNLTISAVLDDHSRDIYLTFDGQVGFALQPQDIVEIKKGPGAIRLIKSPYKSYFEILRTKLRWGEM
jgi:NAD+ kinase